MFAHLTRERISEIKTFLATSNIPYDEQLRSLLLDGINFQYRASLKAFGNDAFQLSGDLNALNSLERLVDGSIPFEMWLRNAIDELSYRDTANILSRALDELTSQKFSSAPISEPAAMPDLKTTGKSISPKDDMVAYAFLAAGLEAGKSVARLQVVRHDNGSLTINAMGESEVHQGTGWLLAPDLMITNHHVINARTVGQGEATQRDLELQAQSTTAQFDYDGSSAGNSLATAELVAFDSQLDYAILRLEAPVTRPPLTINRNRIAIDKDSYLAVNIIQHPNGGPKKVALRNNLVYDSNFPRVRYFTDTQHGSSGSPVFNDSWQVVALHRAATFVDHVVFQGRATGWVNEGTQMAAILADLEARNVNIYRRIAGA